MSAPTTMVPAFWLRVFGSDVCPAELVVGVAIGWEVNVTVLLAVVVVRGTSKIEYAPIGE